MNKSLMILVVSAFLFSCGSEPKRADDVTIDIEDQGLDLQLNDTEEARSFPRKDIERSNKSVLDNSSLRQPAIKIIYFEFDSSDIKLEDRSVIEAHVAYLVSNSNVVITLSGHADERGSREYNLALGEQRANTVKRQMTLLGVSTNQVRVTSYGEEKPVVNEHNDYAWSQNRRVEIIY